MGTRKKLVISVLIYFLALGVRLWGLSSTGVYPDEVTWMVYGKESIYALVKGNLNYFKTAWWLNPRDAHSISWPLVVLNGTSHVLLAGDGKYSFKMFSDIVASRIPVIIVVSLIGPLIFYFGAGLIGTMPALLAGLMYVVDPISIGLDRWLLNDSLLSLFCFLGVVGFLRNSYWSGLWLALAFLTKPNGLFIGISWLVVYLLRLKNKETSKLFWANCFISLFFILLLWPQSWIRPIISIPEYLYNQIFLANNGAPIYNYYLGKALLSPNWTYYFFQLFFRVQTIIVIGFIGAIVLSMKNKTYFKYLPVLSFLIISLLFMSFTSIKGGVRYVSYFFPWIYLAAANFYYRLLRKHSFWLLVFLTISSFKFYPNFYLYYNSLIGGTANASKYDLVGLCIGSKSALNYLDINKIEGLVSVVGCPDAAPYHTSRQLTKKYKEADYIILESAFVQQFPNNSEVIELLEWPVHKDIYDNGYKTATIYKRAFEPQQ